jgi:THO complex subunit 4
VATVLRRLHALPTESPLCALLHAPSAQRPLVMEPVDSALGLMGTALASPHTPALAEGIAALDCSCNRPQHHRVFLHPPPLLIPFQPLKMDKSLDEIIATRPKNARRGSGRRSTGRTQILGSGGVSPSARVRQVNTPPVNGAKAAATPATQPADKIIVSNLPQDVNETQIKELFHSTVGPLRDVTLHYDSTGKSKGVAAVQFQRKGDGTKAYQQYNNRLIDGS